MTPTTSLLVSFIIVAMAFAFAYLWYVTSPRKGSGWALFAAFALATGMKAPTDTVVGVATYAALAIGFSYGWYRTRSMEDSGWLLVIGILAGLFVATLLGQ